MSGAETAMKFSPEWLAKLRELRIEYAEKGMPRSTADRLIKKEFKARRRLSVMLGVPTALDANIIILVDPAGVTKVFAHGERKNLPERAAAVIDLLDLSKVAAAAGYKNAAPHGE